MTYAHVTAESIDAIGNYPDLEWDGTRWWDLRDLKALTDEEWIGVESYLINKYGIT